MGHLRYGRSGPVRLPGSTPLSPMVFHDRRFQFTGSGRASPRLASGPPLRVSLVSVDLSDAPEGSAGGSPAPPGCSVLASEHLVPVAAQALLQLANAPPLSVGPHVQTGGSSTTLSARSSPTLGLAVAGSDTVFSVYGGDIGHTIASARATSTQRLYMNR